MNTSTTAITTSTNKFVTPKLWEGLWRTAGVQSVGLFILAVIFHRSQPLLTAVLSGLAVLNLLWFVAALRTTLTAAGQDGWGAAATAASAVVAGVLLLLITLDAATALHRAAGENPFSSELGGLGWSGFVISSFPRAMLIMAGTFGLWRAKLISNGLFAAGIVALVLVLLGGTTWLGAGVWSPDGLYSRLASPLICFVWIAVVTRVLIKSPATRGEW
jgi:hypothetical protein